MDIGRSCGSPECRRCSGYSATAYTHTAGDGNGDIHACAQHHLHR
jgi:hypothetical protein